MRATFLVASRPKMAFHFTDLTRTDDAFEIWKVSDNFYIIHSMIVLCFIALTRVRNNHQ